MLKKKIISMAVSTVFKPSVPFPAEGCGYPIGISHVEYSRPEKGILISTPESRESEYLELWLNTMARPDDSLFQMLWKSDMPTCNTTVHISSISNYRNYQ